MSSSLTNQVQITKRNDVFLPCKSASWWGTPGGDEAEAKNWPMMWPCPPAHLVLSETIGTVEHPNLQGLLAMSVRPALPRPEGNLLRACWWHVPVGARRRPERPSVRGFRDAQEGETAALVAAGPAGRERRLVAEKRRDKGWGKQRPWYRRKTRPTRQPAATE
jgi:hypothetical protein